MPCTHWQLYNKDYIHNRVTITESGCWEWNLSKTTNGYGQISRSHELGSRAAHRLSYEVFHGEITPHMQVLHRCDNPPCCNPEHLFLGTIADNTQDAMMKGRLKCDPTKAAKSKMIPQAVVDDIFERVSRGERKAYIADIHKIHVSSVYNILNGKFNTLRTQET